MASAPVKSSPKTFFWSYERGTWQYDVALFLILAFVLATPRNCSTTTGERRAGLAGQVLLIRATGNRQTYRVDARILAPPQTRTAKRLHTALQEALPELHTANFSIAK